MFKGQISRYTITIHELIENNVDLGLKDYEIFDENYRQILNNSIIEYYRFREIGFINPAVFINRLNYRIDLIMRNKYNALYKAKMTEFNPLYNVEIHETFSHEISNTADNTSNSKSNSTNNTSSLSNSKDNTNIITDNTGLNLNSTFPSEEMTVGDLTDNIFVDSASKQTGNNNQTSSEKNESRLDSNSEDNIINNSTSSSSGNTIESYTKTTEGSSAGLPFSKALIQLKEFYEKYRLDEEVCRELSDLFISLY